MAGNEYALQSSWRVQGTVQEVYDIVSDADGLDQWWQSGLAHGTKESGSTFATLGKGPIGSRDGREFKHRWPRIDFLRARRQAASGKYLQVTPSLRFPSFRQRVNYKNYRYF